MRTARHRYFLTSSVALYEALTSATDDRARARVIAEAFERLEEPYPHLPDLVTQAHLRETELRLQKEIQQIRLELKADIEHVRAVLRETELRLQKEIEGLRKLDDLGPVYPPLPPRLARDARCAAPLPGRRVRRAVDLRQPTPDAGHSVTGEPQPAASGPNCAPLHTLGRPPLTAASPRPSVLENRTTRAPCRPSSAA